MNIHFDRPPLIMTVRPRARGARAVGLDERYKIPSISAWIIWGSSPVQGDGVGLLSRTLDIVKMWKSDVQCRPTSDEQSAAGRDQCDSQYHC